ncbi:hypothetical protein BC938DRAFT_481069 [Jimgerdemannia flammicorona]|uniref:Uncharacterized protein n=1 Tax=Jimgerdemannia flammicorona TaxID=994334 RepID=A0A433QH21_9FUNG|nr:hypothetical protein BC938DRAFT_481069 [Jimgerdemannia flammicorona]
MNKFISGWRVVRPDDPPTPDVEERIKETVSLAEGWFEKPTEQAKIGADEKLNDAWKAVGEAKETAGQMMHDTTEAARENLNYAPKVVGNKVKDATKTASQKVRDMTEAAGEKVRDATNATENKVREAKKPWEKTRNAKKAAKEKAEEEEKAAMEKAEEEGKAAMEKAEEFKKTASKKVHGASEAVKQKAHDTKKVAEEKIEDVKGVADEKLGDVKKAAGEKLDDMKETAKREGSEVVNEANGYFARFRDWTASQVGGFTSTVKGVEDTVERELYKTTDFIAEHTKPSDADADVDTLKPEANHIVNPPDPEPSFSPYVTGPHDAEPTGQEEQTGFWRWVSGHKAAKDKETQAAAEPTPLCYWFGVGCKPSQDPFASLYTDDAAARVAADRRRRRIESALSKLPPGPSRDRTLRQRDEIASWASRAQAAMREAFGRERSGWDAVMNEVRHDMSEAADKVRHVADGKRSGWSGAKEVVKGAQARKVKHGYEDIELRMREEFDRIVDGEDGDGLKKLYGELRDETFALERKRREEALGLLRRGWERGIREAGGKIEEAERLAEEYRALKRKSWEEAEHTKQVALKKFNEAIEDLRSTIDGAIAVVRARLNDVEARMDHTWDSAVRQVRPSTMWEGKTSASSVVPKDLDSTYETLKRNVGEAGSWLKNGLSSGTPSFGNTSTTTLGSYRHPTTSPTAPLATLYGAVFATWFVVLAMRVYMARKRASVWVGDGTLQMARITCDEYDRAESEVEVEVEVEAETELIQGVPEVEETVVEASSSSVSSTALPVFGLEREDSAVGVEPGLEALAPTTTPTRTTFGFTPLSNYTLCLRLSECIHDLASFTSTIPLLALILAAMELNGYDSRILHPLYIALIASRMLRSERGRAMSNDLGAGIHLGTYVLWTVSTLSALLCVWGWIVSMGGVPGVPVRVVGGGQLGT